MSREKVNKPEEEQQQQPVRRRGISAWTIIQWFLIPLLFVAALGGGLVVGYVILGKKEFSDVLLWSTWKHVYDLVFAP
ncbi:DNA-directed RNA polymerase subunit beta [Paenibacillus sp. LMG 31459]|uniref:DNA-directed RNA polymerase subunit beta n=1 Tax=Paenibacillus phytohabitans TaxID=2654978 RepID=A0ABX1YE70_9BACL|nr:DNA-directed RNA polymerase subunit beta [Paenibacillus phytohabitans]NOU79275.1 DNA-directed RNA polymerase subunit beta [Paenibacillus phytohabitans]